MNRTQLFTTLGLATGAATIAVGPIAVLCGVACTIAAYSLIQAGVQIGKDQGKTR